MPSGHRFEKRFLYNVVGLKSWLSFSCFFSEIVFSISAALSVSDSLLHICLVSVSYHNVFTTVTFFIRCGKPELSRWCLCTLYAGIQMSPDEMVCSRDGCRHSVAEGTVDVPICVLRQIFSARTAFFWRLLHNLQLTSDRCLIFASHLATGTIPAIAIIFRLLCLQRTCGSFKYFSKNALLSFCHNMKSAIYVQYAG